MNHTSGLTRALGLVDMYGDRGFREHLELVAEARLHAAPGERYQYSNANYWLLGILLEDVTGKDYEVVLRDLLFGPLGMDQTRVVGRDTPDIPAGHRYWFGTPVPFGGRFSEKVIATTSTDMSAFLRFQLNDRETGTKQLVSAEGWKALQQPPEGLSYAGGWKQKELGGVQVLRHSGAAADFRAEMFIIPTEGIGGALFFDAYHEFADADFRYLAAGTAGLLLTGDVAANAPDPRFPQNVFGVAFVLGLLNLIPLIGLLAFPWWRRRLLRRRSQAWRAFACFRPMVLCIIFIVVLPIAVGTLTGVPLSVLFTFVPDISLLVVSVLGFWMVWALLKARSYWTRPTSGEESTQGGAEPRA